MPRRTLEPARLPLVVVYGTLTLYGLPSQIVQLTIDNAITQARTLPKVVWAPPLSLAATYGID